MLWDVLRYLQEYILTHGRSPTVKEIQTRFGWASKNSVYTHLRRLERYGYIKRGRYKHRGITLGRLRDE